MLEFVITQENKKPTDEVRKILLDLITHAGKKIDVVKLPLSNGRFFLGHVLFNNARAAFSILKNRHDICQLVANEAK